MRGEKAVNGWFIRILDAASNRRHIPQAMRLRWLSSQYSILRIGGSVGNVSDLLLISRVLNGDIVYQVQLVEEFLDITEQIVRNPPVV